MTRTAVKWLDRRIAAPGPYLALCLSEAEYLAAAKHLGVRDPGPWIKNERSHATANFFSFPDKPTAVIVSMRDWQGREPVEVAGLLIHEAVHIWQRYTDDIGEHNPGSEQEAYAVQSIAQELMAEFAMRMACAAPSP
jgi:hypothetical protein